MSQASIARWNSIPLERPIPSTSKRSRPENHAEPINSDNDDDDDNVSIISRSPSPRPEERQSSNDIHEYDKYARGIPREVITVDTKIKPTNKGFAMLAKLGWVEGQPLGITGDGRVDPIPFALKNDLTGLGKTNQDFRMIETTVSSRRNLDSERQHKETDEQRRLREDAAARKSAIADEISSTLKAFYCSLCDKQFQNVAQYDEHTNSYAHHHKARAKDMQANIRLKPKEDIEKRKEKERRREEKELRKLAAAQGIKIPKPTVPRIPTNTEDATPASATEQHNANNDDSALFSTSLEAASSGARSPWSSVSSSATPPVPLTNTLTTPPGPPPPEELHNMDIDGVPVLAPSFKTSGRTSIVPPIADVASGNPSKPVLNFDFHSAQPTVTVPADPSMAANDTPLTAASESKPPKPPKNQESSRSNWQKFQKKGRR